MTENVKDTKATKATKTAADAKAAPDAKVEQEAQPVTLTDLGEIPTAMSDADGNRIEGIPTTAELEKLSSAKNAKEAEGLKNVYARVKAPCTRLHYPLIDKFITDAFSSVPHSTWLEMQIEAGKVELE